MAIQQIRFTPSENFSNNFESFFDESKKRDLTDQEALKQTIIEFSNTMNSGFADSQEFVSPEGEEARDAFFEKYVDWSNEVLVSALKARGITKIIDTTILGIQGAGKGTYNDSLLQLAKEIQGSDSANDKNDPVLNLLLTKAQTLEVKVGSQGIFAHESNKSKIQVDDISQLEYHELFNNMKIAMGAAGGGLVENNVVCIAVNLYMAYKVLQSPNGIGSFNLDIFPRSEKQNRLFNKTKETLNANGIELIHNSIDFKLLEPGDTEFLVEHKEVALKLIPDVNHKFAELFELAKQEAETYTFDALKKDMIIIFQSIAENKDLDTTKVAEIMQKECMEAIDRAILRAREDDKPIPLFKRLGDYFKNSFAVPFLFENPLVVATKGKPQDIAKIYFYNYLNIPKDSPEIQKGGKYYDYLRRYQNIASSKVEGEFKEIPHVKRFERKLNANTENQTTEYIYFGEGKTIFYIAVNSRGEAISYVITPEGTEILNNYFLEGNGITVNDTTETFWERMPTLWGYENRIIQ